MKQVLQNLRNGQILVADVPVSAVPGQCVLIQTRASLISAGTERSLVEFGKASLLAKARSQPEKVRQVLDKIRTDGLLPTLEVVFNRLDEPMPLGYCNAGVVLEAGPGASEFKPGDRIVSNGPHAEIVCVPKNLCAKIPDAVTDEQAAFAVLCSIALQGIRLLSPTLGEKFVVYGMGLIGLIAAQLLRAHGCEVMGVDLNETRLNLGQQFGARPVNGAKADPVAAACAWTEGNGVDGVLITASAKTDDIMHASAQMCRKRGRIVLVGVVGLNLRRNDFYAKELSFQVSCSYGPGRYDEKYEQGGQDYPLGFVRWTEQRNLQAVLDSLAAGRLVVDPLITHRFPIHEATGAYEKIVADPTALGVILEYPREVKRETKLILPQNLVSPAGKAVIGVIGAGLFAKTILMPSLARSGATVACVADLNGAAAAHLAKKFGALSTATDHKHILQDPQVTGVIIATGHSSHARLVCESLQAGKHVFVEKPLAMNREELTQVLDAARGAPDKMLMVGFNRRFSPYATKMKQLLSGRSDPLCMTMTVNAGFIPPEHWVHDPVRGGGRIIGEACHFIDLMVFLADSPVKTVSAIMVGGRVPVKEDKMSILLGFQDGSVGAVNYFANGSKSYPKELLEVFSDGRVLRLNNFRRLEGYGFKGFRKFKTFRMDKGHNAEFAAFARTLVTGGPSLIPLDLLVNVTLASFAAMDSARTGRTVPL
jgi:predicted dehydrogenase/NADPH:quinone reductase-like Zn-dependent oxidoreductase